MKTSEEMARSVMERARAHKAMCKRRNIAMAAAFVCVCGLGLAAFAMNNAPDSGPDTLRVQSTTAPDTQPATQPTVSDSDVVTKPNENNTVILPDIDARVMMLCASSGSNRLTPVQADLKTPYLEVRVKDLAGLNEDERTALWEAERKYAADAVAGAKGYNEFVITREDGMVTNISVGKFLLHLEDYREAESIHISTGEIGEFWQIPPLIDEETGTEVPGEYYLNERQIMIKYSADIPGGISMVWVLRQDKISDLCLNPSTPLSTLHDTITITVNFKDGTEQVIVIELEFDDSGVVYAVSPDAPETV